MDETSPNCGVSTALRQPVTGERGGGDSTAHPVFAFQMKLRKAIPKCIRAWSDSICATAKREGKVGVLILKEPRLHDVNVLVILRYADWLELHHSDAVPPSDAAWGGCMAR